MLPDKIEDEEENLDRIRKKRLKEDSKEKTLEEVSEDEEKDDIEVVAKKSKTQK